MSDTQSKLYLSQRKPTRTWSRSNRERIAKLRAQSLMAPAGEQAVAIAQANGGWSALDASGRLEVPPELARQLEAQPAAKAFFDAMSPSSRRLILAWIYAAKTEKTRLRRIAETVQLAAQGIKAHHQR